MFLTGFRSFSRKHGRISNGALGRSSNTNLRRISYFVSTTLSTNFHAFSIPFRDPDSPLNVTSSPLIQLSLLRRNNNVFTSAIFQNFNFVSRCDRVLSWLRISSMTMTARKISTSAFPTHHTRTPFYTTPCRQKNPVSLENYASELHQVMILPLSRVGQTFCEEMVSHGRVHVYSFKNVFTSV
jgi:hypothetical protein